MNWINENKRDCKKATFLIEKGMHIPLRFTEQLQLKLHLYTCSWCKTYQKQSKHIQQMMSQVFHQGRSRKELDQQFKQQLQTLILSKLKDK